MGSKFRRHKNRLGSFLGLPQKFWFMRMGLNIFIFIEHFRWFKCKWAETQYEAGYSTDRPHQLVGKRKKKYTFQEIKDTGWQVGMKGAKAEAENPNMRVSGTDGTDIFWEAVAVGNWS